MMRFMMQFAGVLFLGATGAASASCDALPVNVSVDTPPPQVVMKTSDNVAAVGRDQGAHGYGRGDGWHVTGLASSRPKYQVQVAGVQRPGCFRPTTISVEVGFLGPIEVTISSRYYQGSCEFEAIRQHEYRHVDIMRTSVTHYRNEMAAALANAVAKIPPFTFTLHDAQKRVLDYVQASAKGVFDKMMSMSHLNNSALDTPENYQREQAACRNW